MKMIQKTKAILCGLAVVAASVAHASTDKAAGDAYVEVLATNVALEVFNRCSGHGRAVFDACSEVGLPANLNKVIDAVDSTTLAMSKDAFAKKLYDRAQKALVVMMGDS